MTLMKFGPFSNSEVHWMSVVGQASFTVYVTLRMKRLWKAEVFSHGIRRVLDKILK